MIKRTIFFTCFLLPIALYGATIADIEPTSAIQGAESLLNRPEGIAFSPSGDWVAIANYEDNNVLFYRTINGVIQHGQESPAFVLGGFRTPHDVAFSPDGEHLAVACRSSNQVVIHKKNFHNDFFEDTPFAIIDGNNASLIAINAVKYHPKENTLGVCDVYGQQVVLLRYEGDNYESLPYQSIRGPIQIFDKPDGLAFSGDGKLLAITSHATHAVLFYEEIPDSQGYYSAEPVEIIKGEETLFCFPHSVCFHPSDDTLVISSAAGINTLSLFIKQSDTAPRYASTPSQTLQIYNPATIHLQKNFPEEGGVKGVSFSADGRILGICASDIANPDRSLYFYSTVF